MIRHSISRTFIAACALAATATPASACIAVRTSGERIAWLHRSDVLQGVVIVRALSTRLFDPRVQTSWQATGEVVRTVRGPRRAGRFAFMPDRCGAPTPRPVRGDRWVLYLTGDGRGGAHVNLAYPLAVARAADPRLAHLLR